jgi:hypothetical protein
MEATLGLGGLDDLSGLHASEEQGCLGRVAGVLLPLRRIGRVTLNAAQVSDFVGAVWEPIIADK